MRSLLAKAAVRALGPDIFANLVTGNLLGRSPRLGTRDLLRAYSTAPWLRAVADKAASDVASLTWFIAVPQRNGKAFQRRDLQISKARQRRKLLERARDRGELREIPNHPMLDAIQGGQNPFFQGFSVIELTQIFLDLVGEAAWLLERNGAGMPTTTYPIPPTWVSELPNPQRDFYTIDGPSGRADVATQDVLWFYHPDPANPYDRGSGTGMTLGDEIETDEYAAKHTKEWFKNRALPDVLITGDFGEPEKERIEQKWLQRLQGYAKAWRPFFLNRDIKVEKLSQTFENMQLVDLRKSERDTITQIYGVPPEVFGIIENANRSTIDAADYLMKRYVTAPRAEFLRTVLQRRMAPMYDERIVIDYLNPVMEDQQFELEVMKSAPWAAQIDEWRLRMGLEPLGGKQGRSYVMPFANVIMTDLKPEADYSPWDPDNTLGEDPNADDDDGDDAADAPTEEERRYRRARQVIARCRRRVKAEDLTDADIDRIIRAVRPAPLIERGERVMRSTIAKFGQEALDELNLGISFNMRDPAVVDFLRTWGAEKITGEVNQTTRHAIRETLAEGRADGDTMENLAARIEEVFDDAIGSRSMTIARTEVAGASNFAAWEGLDQGGVEEKEWLATQDNHVRDTHEALDGTRVGVNAEFVSESGARGLYPGGFGDPAEDCNCRCAVLAVIPEAAADRVARWKALEADRRPYDRAMRRAMRSGFEVQRSAAMAAFADVVGRAARAA